MRSKMITLGLIALTLSFATGSAFAGDAGAATATTGKTEAASKSEAKSKEKIESPERKALLEDLEKAKATRAETKRALAEAKKGTDKDAIKAAEEKNKAAGMAIHDIETKLHDLKAGKKAAGADKKVN